MTRTEKNAHEAVISHPAHPEHKLELAVAEEKFTCNGCMQLGGGSSYRCEPCDYDIHKECAPRPRETSMEHPLFKGCKLDFLLKPPGPGRPCNACGDVVRGFLYFNRDRDIDLHPCCALNPKSIQIDGVVFDLHTEKGAAALICHRCKDKNSPRNSFWSYRARDHQGKLAYLHVGCIIDASAPASGSDAVRVPTQLLNAPGNITWYESTWNFIKAVGKLSYYLLTFDKEGIFSIGDHLASFFSN